MKDNDDEALLQFRFPAEVDIVKMNKEERMDIFRGFFATSRYNRLLIQKLLVKCALDESFYHKVIEFEARHNRKYMETHKMIESYGYREEFIAAVKEEDAALDKIIEAYNKRMTKTWIWPPLSLAPKFAVPSDKQNMQRLKG